MTYEDIYYLVILGCALFLPFFLSKDPNPLGRILAFIATLALVILYLASSFRTDGVDFSNYYQDFSSIKSIPDIGYQLFSGMFSSFGISFNWFLFFIGCVTIIAINRLAKFFQLSLPLCLLLFLSHSAIVRDLSQMRIGFAIALFMIGLTANLATIKWIFYILAASVHATVLIGILGYESCCYIAKLKNKIYRIIWLITLSVLFILAGQYIEIFSFIDSRIDIYLNWPSFGYGLPVNSYDQIYLHLGSLLIYALLHDRVTSVMIKLRPLVYLEFFGIVLFIAFGGKAIFAYRITNVITSLYFLLIAKSLSESYSSSNISLFKRGVSLVIGYCIILLLLMRSGTSEILSAMRFDIF